MYTTRTASALALVLGLAACSDAPTAAPAAGSTTLSPVEATAARKARPAPSTMLVASPLTDAAGNVVGSFTGTVRLASVAVEGRSLIGTLVLNGTAIVNGVMTPVTDMTATETLYTAPGAAATSDVGIQQVATGCPILDLAIGQIHLNLLGLDVALSAIDLDIVATPGPGQLLGNLLCAVVNLLNGASGGALGNALTNLLNTINQLLGGLLG